MNNPEKPAPSKAFEVSAEGNLVALEFDTWLAHGLAEGWCGPPLCETHDGFPLSEAEEERLEDPESPMDLPVVPLSADEEAEFEEGDPCIHILRLYDSPETKAAVEENHPPSVWRQPR